MFEKENELSDAAIDPPENQGGGNAAISLDSTADEASAIDPPDNQGGGQ